MQTEKPVQRVKELEGTYVFKGGMSVKPGMTLTTVREVLRITRAAIKDASSTASGALYFGEATASSAARLGIPTSLDAWDIFGGTPGFQPTGSGYAPYIEALLKTDAEVRKSMILELLKTKPGLDDEEIGEALGIATFDASKLLREMESKGQIRPV